MYEAIGKMSNLRRFVNCLSHLKKLKLARAYNTVAADSLLRGDDAFFDMAVSRGDVRWNEVHRVPESSIPESPKYCNRCGKPVPPLPRCLPDSIRNELLAAKTCVNCLSGAL